MRKVSISAVNPTINDIVVKDLGTGENIPQVVGVQLTIEWNKPLHCMIETRLPDGKGGTRCDAVEVVHLSMYK